jgi:hypothetical protein
MHAMKRKLLGVLGAAALLAATIAGPAHAVGTGSENADTGSFGDLTITGDGLGFDENSIPVFEDWTGITLNGMPQLASMTINPFTVEDSRGTAAGWHVNLTVSNLVWDDAYVGDPDFTIFADDMWQNTATVTAVSPSDITGVASTGDIATFGNGAGVAATKKIVSATATNGLGLYLVSLQPIKTIVPVNAIAATYQGNATVDVVSGP